MEFKGTYKVRAPRERLWQMLLDPAALSKCIPGCQMLTPNGPDCYDALLQIGVAALKGKYRGKVTISDKRPPEQYRLRIEGSGTTGFVRGDGLLTLAEKDGKTLIEVQGTYQVGGTIASVGQRLVDVAARMLVGQFFRSVQKQAKSHR